MPTIVYELFVNGGPAAAVVAVLWVRQTRMIRAMLTLADALEGVDPDDMKERIKLI